MFASRTLLLSLLGLTFACGTDSEGTATDTDDSTGAATEPGPTTAVDTDPTTTGDTDPTTGDTDTTTGDTDTTGAPVFPMCEEPAGPDNIGFKFSGDSLPLGEDLDMECTILTSQTGPDFTATIDLSCVDAMNIDHAVKIELQLFTEAKLGDLGATKVRLLHRQVDSFDQREVLALRGFDDDSLLLFGARGYDIFAIEDKALWAPLGVSPVAEALCATEGGCDQTTRSALDITLGEVTERVFDRAWTTFAAPALAVHVGAARVIDLYAMDDCLPGDGAEGFSTTVVVIAEK